MCATLRIFYLNWADLKRNLARAFSSHHRFLRGDIKLKPFKCRNLAEMHPTNVGVWFSFFQLTWVSGLASVSDKAASISQVSLSGLLKLIV